MEKQELIPHLFRTEFRKIASVLCRAFGIDHVETAEDITSETFLTALETWTYKGIPDNPTAWLYAVAKNKAKNYINRNHLFNDKIAKELNYEASRENDDIEIDLSEKNITDSQLQMLFAICHPSISAEAQIGLALRILCGFGIEEIADAFLTNKETINKRLFRAKEKLRVEKIKIEPIDIAFTPEVEIAKKLETVLATLYLLFSEGYYSESADTVLREDLCLEAMRLTYLLIENEQTKRPQANALLALMCFHASRFEARKNDIGEIIFYSDQDEKLWKQELIAKGIYFFKEASKGTVVSKYHVEAGIAYWHTIKADSDEKWKSILTLYDQLLKIEYSPVAALNRVVAFSKLYGNEKAIVEAKELNLANNHYYFTLLGELYKKIDINKAKMNFEKAFLLAKSRADKDMIQNKISRL